MSSFINQAAPLLNNILNPSNMNQPLSSIEIPAGA